MKQLLSVLLLCVLSGASFAQIAGPGLTAETGAGANVGSFVFDCEPLPVTVSAGETITFDVWGSLNSPFVLLRADSANQCLSLAGFSGALILDPPFTLVTAGVLSEVSPCLSCPNAFSSYTVTVPPGFPPMTVELQAVAQGGGTFGFTSALAIEVQ